MNKAELVEAVSKQSGMTKVDAEAALNLAFEAIKKAVKKGEDVTLIGFGTFTVSKRKARAGRDPVWMPRWFATTHSRPVDCCPKKSAGRA